MMCRIARNFFLFAFLFFIPLAAQNNIRIETFRGTETAPYIQDIVKLCNAIYREPPYLYNGDDEEYTAYIESLSQANDVVICLVFDGEKAVGLSIGRPLIQTRGPYKETLVEHGYDLNQFFYLGEFGLLSGYRDCRIEEAMYLEIEKAAFVDGAFDMICVWDIVDPNQFSSDTCFVEDYFWKKLGFVQHPELNFQIVWINIGDTQESSHLAVYSIKELKPN